MRKPTSSRTRRRTGESKAAIRNQTRTGGRGADFPPAAETSVDFELAPDPAGPGRSCSASFRPWLPLARFCFIQPGLGIAVSIHNGYAIKFLDAATDFVQQRKRATRGRNGLTN